MVIQLLVIYHNVKELSSALVRENIVLFYITIRMVSVAKNMVFLTDTIYLLQHSELLKLAAAQLLLLILFQIIILHGVISIGYGK